VGHPPLQKRAFGDLLLIFATFAIFCKNFPSQENLQNAAKETKRQRQPTWLPYNFRLPISDF